MLRPKFQRGTKIALTTLAVVAVLTFIAGLALLIIAITRFAGLYT
jgi:hypothetical protein